MEITVLADEQLAREVRGEGTTPLESLVAAAGGRLIPADPEPGSGPGPAYFAIEVEEADEAEALVRRLGMLEGVEAAYLKPAGEAPA